MATSIVEICNNGLISLGDDVITSLDDDLKIARLCKQRWPSILDAVLREHTWACASLDVGLAASSTTPVAQWKYAYPLPSDFLRVVKVTTSDTGTVFKDWEVLGRNLMCNENSPVILRYVRRETDPQQYDALLSETLSARVAMELAVAVTGDQGTMATMTKLYQAKINAARGADSRETEPTTVLDSTWAAAKIGQV